jgi:type IV pilus assembly protein PilP
MPRRPSALTGLRHVAPAVFLFCGLAACSKSDDLADLKRYVTELDDRYKGHVAPLPQLKPYETFAYKAQGLKDPFLQPVPQETQEKQVASAAGIHPDFSRPKEPLEQFPLDALRMVGTLEQNDVTWALISAADGTVYRVRSGNFMGQNYGKIVNITEARVDLAEMVPDGKGGWQEHKAEIELSETGAGGKKR